MMVLDSCAQPAVYENWLLILLFISDLHPCVWLRTQLSFHIEVWFTFTRPVRCESQSAESLLSVDGSQVSPRPLLLLAHCWVTFVPLIQNLCSVQTSLVQQLIATTIRYDMTMAKHLRTPRLRVPSHPRYWLLMSCDNCLQVGQAQ